MYIFIQNTNIVLKKTQHNWINHRANISLRYLYVEIWWPTSKMGCIKTRAGTATEMCDTRKKKTLSESTPADNIICNQPPHQAPSSHMCCLIGQANIQALCLGQTYEWFGGTESDRGTRTCGIIHVVHVCDCWAVFRAHRKCLADHLPVNDGSFFFIHLFRCPCSWAFIVNFFSDPIHIFQFGDTQPFYS